jgi:hypothetical protein
LLREKRRRVDAAGTLFGKRAVLKLIYAALIRGSNCWRGIVVTEFEQRQLAQLRRQLQEAYRQLYASVSKASRKDKRKTRSLQLAQEVRSHRGPTQPIGRIQSGASLL